MYIYLYIYIHTYIDIYIHIYVYVCTWVRQVYTQMSVQKEYHAARKSAVCIYTRRICVHGSVHICMYIYMYICIYLSNFGCLSQRNRTRPRKCCVHHRCRSGSCLHCVAVGRETSNLTPCDSPLGYLRETRRATFCSLEQIFLEPSCHDWREMVRGHRRHLGSASVVLLQPVSDCDLQWLEQCRLCFCCHSATWGRFHWHLDQWVVFGLLSGLGPAGL